MFVVWQAGIEAGRARDVDQVWFAARALLASADPYSLIGPGRAFAWPWPFYYPLPAAFVLLPLAALGQLAARASFVGASAALLAYSITREGQWHRLLLFASGCYLTAVWAAQWSPLLTAGVLAPPLGALVFAAKPNVAIALLAGAKSWRVAAWQAAIAAALFALSIALRPAWLGEWLTVVRNAPHFRAPVALLGGPVALLALLRWRRPEARMLAVLACVPHTTLAYEALPLFLIPATLVESEILTLLSLAAAALPFWIPGPPDYPGRFAIYGAAIVALVYLPCVLMVLRRPNASEAHQASALVAASPRRLLKLMPDHIPPRLALRFFLVMSAGLAFAFVVGWLTRGLGPH